MRLATQPTLREAADAHREPFLWLPEADRPKVQLAKLRKEYERIGKPILLAKSGSAGVYPPESHWLIPAGANEYWIRKHLGAVIGVSDLIPASESRVYHTGCQGDILASLPILKQIGGAHLRIGNFEEPQWQHRNMEGERYEAIRPLLEKQPYVLSVAFEHRAAHTHDLANWRPKHRKDRTLTESQADWLGIGKVDMAPWIMNIDPSPVTMGKVVVARSPRYQNPDWTDFTWPRFSDEYGDKMMFIGLPEEHDAFCAMIHRRVPRLETKTLLDVAELIAGSLLFIGNQSCPCWIAMGLGHPMTQEVSPQVQDSIVRRNNARFPDFKARTHLTPRELQDA